MLLLTSGSNIRCDTTYSVRQISLSAAPENGKRAVRFPFTFLRCRERTHECTNGNATNFATIKHHRSIIYFFFLSRTRNSRATTREVTVIGFIRSLFESHTHEMSPYNVDIYIRVSSWLQLFHTGSSARDHVHAFATEMDTEFCLDFMQQ